MNPQAFRRKLEQAIEQRDAGLLSELEHLAPQSPLTAQLWAEHLQIEQAITQWKALPAEKTQACSCLFSPPSAINSPPVRTVPGRVRLAATLALGICCGWLALLNPSAWLTPEPVVAVTTADTMPDPVEKQESTLADFAQLSWNGISPELSQEAIGTLGAQAESPSLLSYSAVWAEQGRSFIPVVGMLPQFPEVASGWEQGVSQTWETLTSLPLGVQEAWQRMQQLSPADSTEPAFSPEHPAHDHLFPTEDYPRKKLRRPRASRTEPVDHASRRLNIETLA